MIASHTLTVPEVATQLPLWLKQTKQKRHPLWLTTVQDTKPVAVVVAADEYE